MDYNVGDLVIVRDNLTVGRYEGVQFTNSMKMYKNKIFTIRKNNRDYGGLRSYNIGTDDKIIQYSFSQPMLIKIKTNKKPKIDKDIIDYNHELSRRFGNFGNANSWDFTIRGGSGNFVQQQPYIDRSAIERAIAHNGSRWSVDESPWSFLDDYEY